MGVRRRRTYCGIVIKERTTLKRAETATVRKVLVAVLVDDIAVHVMHVCECVRNFLLAFNISLWLS